MKFRKKHLLLASAISLMISGGVNAEENLIKGSALIDGSVSNGVDIIGSVDNIILDEYSNSVEYVLFEVSEVHRPVQSDEKVFVETENVEFFPARAAGEWQVVIEDTDSHHAPQELTLSRRDANHRLLSSVLDSQIQFSNFHLREIEDVLIDPESGEIEYYTVDMEDNSFFVTDIRAIPSEEVIVGAYGALKTTTPLMVVDSLEKYELSAR